MLLQTDEPIAEDTHVLSLWQPLKFKVDSNFKFIKHGFFFNIFSSILLYFIAYPILFVLNKIMFNFEIIGLENIKGIDSGKITVSNHVHYLDCTMVGIANFPKKVYFTSLESNFKIPVVKQLITLLNAIPIPTNKKYTPAFSESINTLLKNNRTVHFYPEASLWPYSKKIRHLKNGAFHFAVDNNVPIVPCVYTFHPVSGLRQIFKHKPFIKMHILKPVYPDISLPPKEAQQKLKETVRNMMLDITKEVYG